MILRQWFERVDSQKTGSITATKLKHYCRMYDLDPNGTMSFEGYLIFYWHFVDLSSSASFFSRLVIYSGPTCLLRLGKIIHFHFTDSLPITVKFYTLPFSVIVFFAAVLVGWLFFFSFQFL
ncbi:uncharacterized protein LOC110825307 isoform X1 [Carica papaya]|uniref:uncharacterized protein LOC110825307 isoform X1 n=1 Tax=Carica papaya TaxID=3649 RepID=UPI000B8D168E|nr:uncharacterized protein LOC110825307 isoform X1 [Carica papaya]